MRQVAGIPERPGFEWFRIRASLAHGNHGDKGYRVRLKYADSIALKAGVRKVSSLDAYVQQPGKQSRTCQLIGRHRIPLQRPDLRSMEQDYSSARMCLAFPRRRARFGFFTRPRARSKGMPRRPSRQSVNRT